MADCICATILLVINPVTQLRLETGRGIVTPLILKEFLGFAAKGFIESGEVRTSVQTGRIAEPVKERLTPFAAKFQIATFDFLSAKAAAILSKGKCHVKNRNKRIRGADREFFSIIHRNVCIFSLISIPPTNLNPVAGSACTQKHVSAVESANIRISGTRITSNQSGRTLNSNHFTCFKSHFYILLF